MDAGATGRVLDGDVAATAAVLIAVCWVKNDVRAGAGAETERLVAPRSGAFANQGVDPLLVPHDHLIGPAMPRSSQTARLRIIRPFFAFRPRKPLAALRG